MDSGERLAHFQLIKPLGKGGMGQVWLARDLSLGRSVALKFLSESIQRDEWAERRFRREAQILASLNHPNIAQIYELEEVAHPREPGTHLRVIVMELVEGPGFEAGKPVPVKQALEVARQLALALQAAHEQGVIHRDLKPANLRLDRRGQLKVLDFGLARFLPTIAPGDRDTTQELSDTGVVGTPAYMAPELIRSGEATEKTDIWAYGCTIYELVTGKRLIGGGNLPEVIGNVLEGNFSFSWPKEVPRELRRIFQRCCAQDPQDRPTAAQLVSALDRSLNRSKKKKRLPVLAALALTFAGALWVGRWYQREKPQELLDSQGRIRLSVVAKDQDSRIQELADRCLQAATALPFAVVVPPRQAHVLLVCQRGAPGGPVLTVEEPATKRLLARVADVSPSNFSQGWQTIESALRREHTRRELLQEDEFFAFLVSYARNPISAIAFRNGVQLLLRTRYRDAEQEFTKAWEADRHFWPAPLALALTAKGQAQFEQAAQRLRTALASCPHPDSAESLVLESVSAFINDDVSRQLEATTKALKFFPNSTYLLYRTARVLRQKNRPEEAIPLLLKLTKKASQQQYSPMWETLALCQLLAGKYKECLKTCQLGRERFPTRYQYDLYAAYASQLLGDVLAAREKLASAIRKNADFGPWSPLQKHQFARYWAACIRYREEEARQWQAVLAEAEKILQDDAQNREAAAAKAEALLGLGRIAEASSVITALGAEEKLSASELVLAARIARAANRPQDSRQLLRQFADLWPELSEFAKGSDAYNAATAWAELGELGEAGLWLARALDFHGGEVLDLLLDPDLEPLRQQGLLAPLLDQLRR